MKTIEERAWEKYPEVIKHHNLAHIDINEEKRKMYIEIATEQKSIDDAEWLKLKSAWEKESKEDFFIKLKDYTTEELMAELKRRNAEEKAKKEPILRCRMCKHWGTIDYWGNPTNYTVGDSHSCKFFKTKDGKCYKRHRASRPACKHFERKEE